MTATFFQHRIKCGHCGLHFTVHSDHEDWWTSGDRANNNPTCPECGILLTEGGFMHWVAKVEGFIFNHVEGKDATLINDSVTRWTTSGKATVPDEVLKAGTKLTERLDVLRDLDNLDKLVKEVEAPDGPQS